MPVVRRTQISKTLPLGPVRTTLPRPSYPIGSIAARLQARGLPPRQVDASHPKAAPIRGAGHTGPIQRSAVNHAAASAAALGNQTLLRTGRAPIISARVRPNPSAYPQLRPMRRAGGSAAGHGGAAGASHGGR